MNYLSLSPREHAGKSHQCPYRSYLEVSLSLSETEVERWTKLLPAWLLYPPHPPLMFSEKQKETPCIAKPVSA